MVSKQINFGVFTCVPTFQIHPSVTYGVDMVTLFMVHTLHIKEVNKNRTKIPTLTNSSTLSDRNHGKY